MLADYGMFGYAFAIPFVKAVAAICLVGDAYLMYRMYKGWDKEEADRYFTGLVVMGATLAATGLVGGLAVSFWLSRVPDLVVENVVVGIGSSVVFYFICKMEGIVLSREFSVERIQEDLKWIWNQKS